MQETQTNAVNNSATLPEVLAPVGGREQFFAALNSGADAVFLGLKNFNARARAENFSLDDLRELIPVAHSHGMRVLVTMNILIKNVELQPLLEVLSALEEIEVDAIIVQDLGLARLCREYFPQLRLHASTQMAVHNLDGVLEAMRCGFKRVVLARELTALEIKKIRAAVPREQVELEAFCHGSLCYSYSGLCFFSGAEDARSGNRGECAYTCRKPYKILNEPGHGFLFSMKDFNTVETLNLLVDAGVDTLKIEGRKKDAQYVSTVVRAYRQRLDEIFGRTTLRRNAPALAHELNQAQAASKERLREDLSLTFQRGSTSFFLKGRYHENVIDLNNPTHKGQAVGEVLTVRGRKIEILAQCSLEKFDGLRIDPAEELYHAKPQHGESQRSALGDVSKKYQNEVCHFSLRSFWVEGKSVTAAAAGSRVSIDLPQEVPLPQVGDRVVRTRSDALRQEIEKRVRPPADTRLRPFRKVEITFKLSQDGDELRLCAEVSKLSVPVLSVTHRVAAVRPQAEGSGLEKNIKDLFTLFGNIGFKAEPLSVEGDEHWFVARSVLKELKREIEEKLPGAYSAFVNERLTVASEKTRSAGRSLTPRRTGQSSLAIKIDRLEYLPWIEEFHTAEISAANLTIEEVVFEPKRTFLPQNNFGEVIQSLLHLKQRTGLRLRLAFPTVLRAWDEPLMKRWTQLFLDNGITDIEIGNLGVLSMIERWGMRQHVTSIRSDFTLYTLNTAAAAHWGERGIDSVALSVEDDFNNIKDSCKHWPEEITPQAILFKDTPLFIAESCSLTALHNGCPTNAVCGYRTLEIQNDAGEQFFVAHETCKSIVFDKRSYSITHKRHQLEEIGLTHFRADFLTRAYDENRFKDVLRAIVAREAVSDTHGANFDRTLL